VTSSRPGVVTNDAGRCCGKTWRRSPRRSSRRRRGAPSPHLARSATASRVEGEVNVEPSSTPERPRRLACCERTPRSAERARLAVHLHVEVAGRRWKRDNHRRSTAEPGSCPPRARPVPFLPPRLRTAAGDEPAALRGARASAGRRSSRRAPSRGRRAASVRRRRPFSLRGSDLWPSRRWNRREVPSARAISDWPPALRRSCSWLRERRPLIRSRFSCGRTSCTTSPLSGSRALPAEAARHLHPLEDPARALPRQPIEPGLRDVVRAVRGGAAVETVPLDRSGEALPMARCR